MNGLGEDRVCLLQDAEEGGVSQMTLGGTKTAVLGGGEADDEGVRIWRLGICNRRLRDWRLDHDVSLITVV